MSGPLVRGGNSRRDWAGRSSRSGSTFSPPGGSSPESGGLRAGYSTAMSENVEIVHLNAQVLTLREGLILRWEVYWDRGAARSAAGLEE